MSSDPRVGGDHTLAFMRMVHLVTAANTDRPTSKLDTRARLVVQTLGLDGPQPLAVVGQRLGHSPSTMTGIADRLEHAGLARRRADREDRRVTLLALTGKGHRAFGAEKGFYNALVTQTLSRLTVDAQHVVLDALLRLELNPTADRPDQEEEIA